MRSSRWRCRLEAVEAAAYARIELRLAPLASSLAGGLPSLDKEVGDCRVFTRVLADYAGGLDVIFRFASEVRSLVRQSARIAAVETSKGRL